MAHHSAVALMLATLFALGLVGAEEEASSHVRVTPEGLRWSAVPSRPSGAQLAVMQGPLDKPAPFTFRLKLPAGYQIPPHWHPSIEHVTVLSESFYMGLGDTLDRAKSKRLNPGSVAIMSPTTHHFAWTDAETIVQVHGMGPWAIHYVHAADDPRKQ